MRIYDNDGTRPGPPHDFYIATVNDHRWAQAQYEEGVDYDTCLLYTSPSPRDRG